MTIPLPETSSTTALWRSPAGRLLLGHCRSCDEVHHYPRPICPRCHSTVTDLVEASGRGRIVSWTVSRTSREERPPIPAFVALEEGPGLLTRIADARPEQVAVGAAVTVVFRDDELDGAPQFVLEVS
ncbi:OB-fold domain-containing protein [Pseudonocardia sp. NPDC049154]|uniref:Zn-ribbon domain-containing OB-fold protein n=1 Tax=Pseudonocardia sp. NPDC049154 TaxID=3155501 RepID=UPI0033F989F5